MRNKERVRLYSLLASTLFMVVFCWYTVFSQSRSLEASAIKTYQEAQLEVVKNAARAATLYIEGRLERGGDVEEIEMEVLRKIVGPIRIGTVGDAWIYSPDHVVFDRSEDFPDIYKGKNMRQIFDLQKENGASHYQTMTDSVMKAEEGMGWYVWEPKKAGESAPWWDFLTRDSGIEIAAWTPVVVFPGTEGKMVWIIGMSAMLTEIMRINGSYDQVQVSIITVSIITLLVIFLLISLRSAEARVRELKKEVQRLRIEIDEQKKAEQVSEIVDSEYFQDLITRANTMKNRRKQAPPSRNGG